LQDSEYLRLSQRFNQDAHVAAVLQLIEQLDLTPLHQAYRGTGSKPYPPQLMLSVALFEMLDKRCSPAQWQADAATKDQCKLLARGIQPSRAAWYQFRDRCGVFIRDVADQVVRQAIHDELVDPRKASLDGTFIRSAATRHRIVNFSQLTKRIETLHRAIDILDGPRAAELTDWQLCGLRQTEAIPAWVAPTCTGRELQQRQYEIAKNTFIKRFAANAAKPRKYQKDEAKITLSIWDCDAVIGRDKEKVVCPLYNVQTMVACGSGVIVSYEVFAQCTDAGTLGKMIDLTQQVSGNRLRELLADCGYCSLLDLQDCDQRQIELFAPVQDITGTSFRKAVDGEPQLPQSAFTFDSAGTRCVCPGGHPMVTRARGSKPRADGRSVIEVRWEQSVSLCGSCPLASRCLQAGSKYRSVARLEGQEKLDAQAAKMSSEVGKRYQKERATTVERVFGDGKENRGFRRHHCRSHGRAKAEIGLLVVAQNILRLYNLRKSKQNTPP
jgi:transposase